MNVLDRCKECNKKILYSTKCKCGDIYCLVHLTRHKCNFDYHNNHKRKLEQELVKVVKQKVTI